MCSHEYMQLHGTVCDAWGTKDHLIVCLHHVCIRVHVHLYISFIHACMYVPTYSYISWIKVTTLLSCVCVRVRSVLQLGEQQSPPTTPPPPPLRAGASSANSQYRLLTVDQCSATLTELCVEVGAGIIYMYMHTVGLEHNQTIGMGRVYMTIIYTRQ